MAPLEPDSDHDSEMAQSGNSSRAPDRSSRADPPESPPEALFGADNAAQYRHFGAVLGLRLGRLPGAFEGAGFGSFDALAVDESDENGPDDENSEDDHNLAQHSVHEDESSENGASTDGSDTDLGPGLLRRLAQGHRSAQGLGPGDPRTDFIRAMDALLGGRPAGFSDVMERLMAGGIAFGGGRESAEFDGLIANLDQREDPYLALETLNELLERLLMMNGITAERVIPANRLARSLVGLMRDPALAEDLELHLVACRCLYNFLEVNQDFIHDALHNQAVECLCEKLLEVSYIDLTEQALQTLEMMSRETVAHDVIVASNGLRACLQFLDFLTVHAQRRCLTIVANACTNVLVTNFGMVKDAFESISAVVRTHDDAIVLENGWLAISRIVVSFRWKPALLEELFLGKEALLTELVLVVKTSAHKNSTASSSGRPPVSYSSCLSLIRLLNILASVSTGISRILLEHCCVGQMVVEALNKYAKTREGSSQETEAPRTVPIEALMAAPKELLLQLLNLVGYLIPTSYSAQETPFLKDAIQDSEERQEMNKKRADLYRDEISDAYWTFVNDIWPLLVSSFQATMDYDIRRRIVISLNRIVSFCEDGEATKISAVDLVTGMLVSVANSSKSMLEKEFREPEDVDMLSSDNNEDPGDEESPSRLLQREDLPKLHANVLLLSVFLLTKRLIEKSSFELIHAFEREGLINDILAILRRLRADIRPQSADEQPLESQTSIGYGNKSLNPDFTMENDFGHNSNDIYAGIISVGCAIEQLHASSQSEMAGGSENARILPEIKAILANHRVVKTYSAAQWTEVWTLLQYALSGGSGGAISSFEMISSGMIDTLAHLFMAEGYDFGYEFSDCYQTFVGVFFGQKSAVLGLVNVLQEALTRSEAFEIVSAGPLQNDSHTAAMARQVKLRLVAEGGSEGNKLPLAMQNMVLAVHAIATFKLVDAFLRQRFRFIDEVNGEEMEDEMDEEMDQNRPKKDDSIHTEFLINGEVIPNETTIYGAVYRSLQAEADETVEPSRVWQAVHTVLFRKVSSSVAQEQKPAAQSLGEAELDVYDETSIGVLRLLRVLFDMNVFSGTPVSPEAFMNWKLAVKLNRQLEEPLVVASGTLPGWSIHLTKHFPFIFPLDTRMFFLQSTSFGYLRLIHQWQLRTNQEYSDAHNGASVGGSVPQRAQLGRPTRQKVRISRKLLLQSAIKVLQLYGTAPGFVEIEYFDEVGLGLGPTLEFYAQVLQEFARRRLQLWRDAEKGDEESYVLAPQGLFPAPLDKNQISSENGRKVLFFFATLGKFVARALLDLRIVDFHFCPSFLALVQFFNRHAKLAGKDAKKVSNMATLRMVDSALAESLAHLTKYTAQYAGLSPSDREKVTVDGATLEDLSLSFVLPGFAGYELVAGGLEMAVSASNVELYISKVIEATLFLGVAHQIKAFMEGFSKVFPVDSLVIFLANELASLFGSAEEDWSAEMLTSAIHANHGYTKESDAVQQLVRILVGFTTTEKRTFLQFLTGLPRLPVGGFKALRPELTVVKKHPEGGLSSDDYLPSVMTCANYLKLPQYSLEEKMRQRLLQAANEGAGAFLLS